MWFRWIYLSSDKNKNIKEIIKEYTNNKTPAIKVPRYNFGNNGHINKPNGGVIENYTKREAKFSSYKAISNIDFINRKIHTLGVHRYLYTTRKGIINKGIKISAKLNQKHDGHSDIPLQMNHYFTKSYKEYVDRCLFWKDKPINFLGKRKNCHDKKLFNDNNVNQVEDLTAYNIYKKINKNK